MDYHNGVRHLTDFLTLYNYPLGNMLHNYYTVAISNGPFFIVFNVTVYY